MSEILAVATRGKLIESMHRGDVAVVDDAGGLVMSVGDPEKVTYMRSASKPIQASPVVSSGAKERFGIAPDELAIMASSHSAQAQHVSLVSRVLSKVGLSEADLRCGTHPPFHKPTSDEMVRRGQEPTPIHCNCSGKHAAMLVMATHIGAALEGYWLPEHPVQRLILEEVAAYTGMGREDIETGVDGCGVPVFAMPLANMALGYARLANGKGLPPEKAAAAREIASAMMSHPFVIAGEGRLCTELASALPGKLIGKSGAEGVYCLSLPKNGLGIAIKVEDGNQRAMGPIVVNILKRLGVFSRSELEILKKLERIPLTNFRREIIGEIYSTL
jgi:L-asparaginase II